MTSDAASCFNDIAESEFAMPKPFVIASVRYETDEGIDFFWVVGERYPWISYNIFAHPGEPPFPYTLPAKRAKNGGTSE